MAAGRLVELMAQERIRELQAAAETRRTTHVPTRFSRGLSHSLIRGRGRR